MKDHRQAAIEAKADRAIQAIELLAKVMVEQGAYEDRVEALAHILGKIGPADPTRPLTQRIGEAQRAQYQAEAAEVWAQIGLAAGLLEGVKVRGVEEVDKLPTYNSSRPLIIQRLAWLLGPPVEHPADPFEGLVR
jgi:hypothetical protein